MSAQVIPFPFQSAHAKDEDDAALAREIDEITELFIAAGMARVPPRPPGPGAHIRQFPALLPQPYKPKPLPSD
jgi:hypothetical protein